MKLSSFLPKPRELPTGQIPKWIPGSTTINEFLDWPEEAPKPKMSLGSIAMVGVDEALMVGLGMASRLRFPTPGFRQRCADEMEELCHWLFVLPKIVGVELIKGRHT